MGGWEKERPRGNVNQESKEEEKKREAITGIKIANG